MALSASPLLSSPAKLPSQSRLARASPQKASPQPLQRVSVVARIAMAPERRRATPNCFTVLGVPSSAGADEIRQAYRRLARVYHPDASGAQDTTPMFLEIHAAYKSALKHQERRQAKAASSESATEPSRPSMNRQRPIRRRDDFDDIWDMMGASSPRRQASPRRQPSPRRQASPRQQPNTTYVEHCN